MHWVFLHGWGFGPECWTGWKGSIPNSHFFDRGYFKTPIPLCDLENCLVITHSYGLHMLAQAELSRIKKLVIIGGFVHIHGKQNTKAYLAWLMKGLKTHPEGTLTQFYRDCGLEEKAAKDINLPALFTSSVSFQALSTTSGSSAKFKAIPSSPAVVFLPGEVNKANLPLLIQDLNSLNNSILDIERLKIIPEILLLHGTEDQIAPLEKAIELQSLLPNSKLITLDGGTHALPIVNATECFQWVKRWL